MKIEQLSTKYTVKRIDEEDAEEVYQLELGNPLYFEFCPPEPSVEQILKDRKALPPNTSDEDKFYLGFYNGNQLVAVMDLILRYPNSKTAFIGFFMMNSQYQGQGVGSAIMEECLLFLKKNGFSAVRLGYMQGNAQSEHFWSKNGFDPTGIETDNGQGTVVVLQKQLDF